MASEENDTVNLPNHYIMKSGMETIDVIAYLTKNLVGISAVCIGNAIKYISRYKHKNGVEDVRKARKYIMILIKHFNNDKSSVISLNVHDSIDNKYIEEFKDNILSEASSFAEKRALYNIINYIVMFSMFHVEEALNNIIGHLDILIKELDDSKRDINED